jgi:hypothetical protein
VTVLDLVFDENSMTTANYALYGGFPIPRAATTLLAAGLLVSTFDLADLLLVEGAVFLPTSDFFSIAILSSPRLI